MSDDIIKRLREAIAELFSPNAYVMARSDYDLACHPANITALLDRLDKAERENERLREDAERLDSGLIRLVDRDEFGESVATVYSQVDLRAAIDAAMAAEQSDERSEK